MLQEAGPSLPPPSSLKLPQPTPAPPFWEAWKKIPGWAYIGVVVLSIAITLLEAYPWLSIEEQAMLDPTNPYSEMFKVANGGYIPVTNLDVLCTDNFDTSGMHGHFSDIENNFRSFAAYLGHGQGVTLPCFRSVLIPGLGAREGATLDVTVTYSYYLVPKLRRSQAFRFRSIVGSDGSSHWEFLG